MPCHPSVAESSCRHDVTTFNSELCQWIASSYISCCTRTFRCTDADACVPVNQGVVVTLAYPFSVFNLRGSDTELATCCKTYAFTHKVFGCPEPTSKDGRAHIENNQFSACPCFEASQGAALPMRLFIVRQPGLSAVD